MTEKITTPAELDALPVGTLVMFPLPHLSRPVPFERHERGWQQPGDTSHYDGELMAARYLPATVLYRPDTPAPSAECPVCGRNDGLHKMSCRPQNSADAAGQPAEDREALAAHLVALGLAEERPGYGHATGAQVADATLAWFAARQPAPTVSAEQVQIIASESGRPESVVRDWLHVAGIEVTP